MTDSIAPELLNFLSEPRSLKEVAEHLGVSASVADGYLQEAVEQKLVLIWKWQKNTTPRLKEMQRSTGTPLYISRDSSLLPNGLMGFAAGKVLYAHEISQSRGRPVKFGSTRINKANFSLVTESALVSGDPELKSGAYPRILRSKERMRCTPRYTDPLKSFRSTQTQTFSVAEKLSMLKALSCQSLSYLDIQARFSVPKRVVRTYIKNGLIKEAWGPRNIGVRLLLTEKGERQLRRLKRAAMLQKDKVRKATIQLKYRSL